jgi:hypothetical protein
MNLSPISPAIHDSKINLLRSIATSTSGFLPTSCPAGHRNMISLLEPSLVPSRTIFCPSQPLSFSRSLPLSRCALAQRDGTAAPSYLHCVRPAQGGAPAPPPLPPPPPPALPLSPDGCGGVCSEETLGASPHLFPSLSLSLRHRPSPSTGGALPRPLSPSPDVARHRPGPCGGGAPARSGPGGGRSRGAGGRYPLPRPSLSGCGRAAWVAPAVPLLA